MNHSLETSFLLEALRVAGKGSLEKDATDAVKYNSFY